MRIVFVCAGNICRSALAERLFRRRLPGQQTASFGLIAEEGAKPGQKTLDAGRAAGVDLADHRALRFAPSLLRPDDLVFTMEPGQRDAIRAAVPAARVRCLAAELDWESEDAEVVDPENGSPELFAATAGRITAAVESLLRRLQAAADLEAAYGARLVRWPRAVVDATRIAPSARWILGEIGLPGGAGPWPFRFTPPELPALAGRAAARVIGLAREHPLCIEEGGSSMVFLLREGREQLVNSSLVLFGRCLARPACVRELDPVALALTGSFWSTPASTAS